jgi:hypothetical protein
MTVAPAPRVNRKKNQTKRSFVKLNNMRDKGTTIKENFKMEI